MIERITWKEFQESGMLWWINMILHTFGLAIVIEVDNSEIVDVYPARVKYRGFSENENTKGYQKVSNYMNENARQLLKESYE